MNRNCVDCGAVKVNADMTADEKCPKCGLSFLATSTALAQQLRIERAPRRDAAEMSRTERLCWVATIVGSSLGIVQVVLTAMAAASAPQQAAGAALAVATAATPYCLARAVQIGFRK